MPRDAGIYERRGAVHARLSTYAGQPDELTTGFNAQTDALAQLDGFEAAYFGVSNSGTAFSLTVWKTEEALEASAERAKEMRSEATEPSGAEIQSVEHFEITATAGNA
jgi:heme-degrading monooxygenase HmoA